MTETIAPVTYSTPCVYCIMYRPGCAPNYVRSELPNSHGCCQECLVLARVQRRLIRAAVTA